MVPRTTVSPLMQRKAEQDGEVALISQTFVGTAPKLMPNNIIARAMPMAEAQRVADEEEKAAKVFQKMENEASLYVCVEV